MRTYLHDVVTCFLALCVKSRSQEQGPAREQRQCYAPYQEFSEVREEHFIIAMLQHTSDILEKYHFVSSDDKKEITTDITHGAMRLRFPGAIPESFFEALLEQNVTSMVTERHCYEPLGMGINWRCIEEHVLQVHTGKMSGKSFYGAKYWLASSSRLAINKVEEKKMALFTVKGLVQ